MKFRKGDKVKFLNEIGGGIVVNITGNILHVENQDGFEIPVSTNEVLLVAESQEHQAGESNNHNHTPPSKPEKQRMMEISPEKKWSGCLAFVPEKPEQIGITDIKLYLVNDSEYYIMFNIFCKKGESHNYVKAGQVGPDSKILITKLSQTEASKWSEVRTQILFTGKGSYQPKAPLERIIGLQGAVFYKENLYTENAYFIEHSFIISLDKERHVIEYENDIDDIIIKEKEAKEQKTNHKSPKPSIDIIETDLHIHELTDSTEGLSNTEMLEMQMDAFRKALLKALTTNSKRIVFIHGVGNGTLKTELRRELDRKYPKLYYQDASFKEYGFGATMVNLR